jgi:hypothetical protein
MVLPGPAPGYRFGPVLNQPDRAVVELHIGWHLKRRPTRA